MQTDKVGRAAGSRAGSRHNGHNVIGVNHVGAPQLGFGGVHHGLHAIQHRDGHGPDSPIKIQPVGHLRHMRKGIDLGAGPVLGNQSRGVAGGGKDGNAAHVQLFSHMGHTFADCLGNRQLAAGRGARGAVILRISASVSTTMRAIMLSDSRG